VFPSLSEVLSIDNSINRVVTEMGIEHLNVAMKGARGERPIMLQQIEGGFREYCVHWSFSELKRDESVFGFAKDGLKRLREILARGEEFLLISFPRADGDLSVPPQRIRANQRAQCGELEYIPRNLDNGTSIPQVDSVLKVQVQATLGQVPRRNNGLALIGYIDLRMQPGEVIDGDDG
jgi:hypothetical protein